MGVIRILVMVDLGDLSILPSLYYDYHHCNCRKGTGHYLSLIADSIRNIGMTMRVVNDVAASSYNLTISCSIDAEEL